MNRNFAMTHFSKRFRLRRRPVPRLMRIQRTSGGPSDTGADYFANARRVRHVRGSSSLEVSKDAPLHRHILREMLSKVEIYWTQQVRGKITRSLIDRGTVFLRSSEEVSYLSPSADQSHCSCCRGPRVPTDRPLPEWRTRRSSLPTAAWPGTRPARLPL